MRRPVQTISTLHIALGVSLAVHAGLLFVRMVDPEGFNRVFEDTPLEVILVNARSKEAPVKAQALAQAHLAGGGEADAGRATSPLPRSAVAALGENIEDEYKQIEELQETQEQLLAQHRERLAQMPVPSPKEMRTAEGRARMEQRKRELEILAEIEKRVREENARPKKRYVSPATKGVAHALYYDTMSRKIEERGTRNFPEQNGKRLYGDLTMMITVDYRGQVVETEVVRPSKNALLDKRAIAIVRAAAPFGAFTPAMRKEADQYVFTTKFTFEGEGLRTRMMANPAQP
jgi:protein TonB